MPDAKCRISDAEWLVMKVLWKRASMTASDVVECLRPETGWSPKTVQTLLARLVNKGALAVHKENGLNQYCPSVSQKECIGKETDYFLKKVYDGSFPLFLANFVKNEKLSPEELQKLKDLLEEKLEQQEGDST